MRFISSDLKSAQNYVRCIKKWIKGTTVSCHRIRWPQAGRQWYDEPGNAIRNTQAPKGFQETVFNPSFRRRDVRPQSRFGIRPGQTTFAIFDAFPDDAGRDADLSGKVAKTLMEKAPELLAEPPKIEKADVFGGQVTGLGILLG